MFLKPIRSVLASSVIVLGLAGCGGKAEHHQPELADSAADEAEHQPPELRDCAADGGPAYGDADADSQDARAAAPSTVRHSGGASDEIDSHARAQCEPGFQGFSAQLGDMHVNLFAFVSEPGDYQGDPIQILYVEVTRGGEHYRASAGTTNAEGTISLHVDSVRPRFVGRVVASLPAIDDTLRAPLTLDLSFDIAPASNCGGKL